MIIDFHSHILCDIDHGSSSLASSLRMLGDAKKAGVDIIVATPHFYSEKDDLSEFLKKREGSLKKIRENFENPPIIIAGAEVTLSVDLPRMSDLEKLCVGNTNCILIEMPYQIWTYWVFDAIFYMITARELIPIIAHVERYKDKKGLEKLLSMEVMAQMNASSVLPYWNFRRSVKLVKQNKIQLLGSDIHENRMSYDLFARSLKKMDVYGEKMMEYAKSILNIHI